MKAISHNKIPNIINPVIQEKLYSKNRYKKDLSNDITSMFQC